MNEQEMEKDSGTLPETEEGTIPKAEEGAIPEEEEGIIPEAEEGTMPDAEGKKKTKKKWIIGIAAGLVAAILIAFFCFSGWVQLPWMTNRYFLQHGLVAKQAWVQDGDSYFYTDENGCMVTGLQEIDGSHYYFEPETGVMQTGWITDGKSDQKMYFKPGSGKAPVGWTEIEGNVYRFSEQAVMLTGWQTVDDKKYYMDEEGRRCTGWQTIDGEEYYLDQEGAMHTGWLELDGDTYFLDKNGHKCTGRQTVKGKEYFFDNDGVMRTGWSQTDGKRYYYGSDGSMQTGLITVDGEKFYLGKDGAVDPGWHDGEDGSFYVCADGFVVDPEDGTGNYGRLIVRNVGIDVFLYTGNSRDDYQAIVNEENSAVVVQERRDLEPVIADRRSQGFDLSGIVKGNKACLVYADGTIQEYVCSRTTTGRNLGNDVVDGLNISIWRQNTGGIAAYSSAGKKDSAEVIAVFWEPVKSEAETSADENSGEENSADESSEDETENPESEGDASENDEAEESSEE